MATVKEIVTDQGGNITVEYSDDSVRKFNQAETLVVTADSGLVAGRVIIGSALPSDADGQPNGTIYIQVQ